MQQYKFRAWHNKFKKMKVFTFNDITDSGNAWGIKIGLYFHDLFASLDDPNLKIMRYLGENCLDINGKEYCEDDLVKLGGHHYIVMYDRCRYMLRAVVNKNCVLPLVCNMSKGKIVGNIHQNPELIK